MDEVGSALIAIALVLCAVFVPAAFHHRTYRPISYRQFAAHYHRCDGSSSLIVSLTLSPAMCALLLKPHTSHQRDGGGSARSMVSFRAFNFGFGRARAWLRLASWHVSCASPS